MVKFANLNLGYDGYDILAYEFFSTGERFFSDILVDSQMNLDIDSWIYLKLFYRVIFSTYIFI